MRILCILLVAFSATAFAQTNEQLTVPTSIKKTAPYKPTLKVSGFVDVPGMTEESFAKQAKKLNLDKAAQGTTLTDTELLTWEGEWTYKCTLPVGCSNVNGVIKFSLTLMPGKENYYYEFGSFQHVPSATNAAPLAFKTITTDSLVPYHGLTPASAKWEQLAWEDLNNNIKNHIAATLKLINEQMAAAGK